MKKRFITSGSGHSSCATGKFLTLSVPMNSSFIFYTICLGWSIVYIEGVTGYNFKKILYFFL